MTMSSGTVEYILNSAAWWLGGILTILTYQRVLTWYRKSRGMGKYQLSAVAYIGVMMVGLTLISVLFTSAVEVKQQHFQDCQTRVNGVNTQNSQFERDQLYGKKTGLLQKIAEAGNPAQVLQDIHDAQQYNLDHPVIPVSSCN